MLTYRIVITDPCKLRESPHVERRMSTVVIVVKIPVVTGSGSVREPFAKERSHAAPIRRHNSISGYRLEIDRREKGAKLRNPRRIAGGYQHLPILWDRRFRLPCPAARTDFV